jgi:hypothetical protein
MPGDAQQHESEDMRQPVSASTQVTKLVDQVEEGKQHQKRRKYEQSRSRDLRGKIALDYSHLR